MAWADETHRIDRRLKKLCGRLEEQMNAHVLLNHPLTMAGVIAALGAFFALTSNFVKTIDVIKEWLKRGNKSTNQPTKNDVRDAGVPVFGQTPSFGKNFLAGAAAAGVGAYAADAVFHAATTHSHDVASGVIDHAGALSDHASHAEIAGHAIDHADSISDVVSGLFEAIFG